MSFLFFFRTFFRPHKVTNSAHLPCPTERRQHQGLIGVPGLVQLKRVPGEIALPRKQEFQQRRGDGALRSECQQAKPPSNPSCARSSPEWQRHL